jgi:Domain of unknown function (DUF4272)
MGVMNFQFWKKQKLEAPKVEEDDDDGYNPPSIERIRLRLMVLAANGARSHAESHFNDSPVEWTEDIAYLEEYVLAQLSDELTEAERNQHQAKAGTWDERMIVADSWDREATAPLLWALGIQRRTQWHTDREIWDELFDWPDLKTWRPDAKVIPLRDIDDEQRIYETIYWRIRSRENPTKQDLEYSRKLMGRAAKLNYVTLAHDGDLANLDGVSISNWDSDSHHHAISIVMERLHALNWLIGQEPDWDMITRDTVVNWLWDEHWK